MKKIILTALIVLSLIFAASCGKTEQGGVDSSDVTDNAAGNTNTDSSQISDNVDWDDGSSEEPIDREAMKTVEYKVNKQVSDFDPDYSDDAPDMMFTFDIPSYFEAVGHEVTDPEDPEYYKTLYNTKECIPPLSLKRIYIK